MHIYNVPAVNSSYKMVLSGLDATANNAYNFERRYIRNDSGQYMQIKHDGHACVDLNFVPRYEDLREDCRLFREGDTFYVFFEEQHDNIYYRILA
ncbi:MAG: hypothetical protein HUJ51_02690 [Eggerthellaceae bacterium]|nr:hypothetical protein [Eggerthellaceae bacterium]